MKGKTRTAKVTSGADGTLRIQSEAATFMAKFRNGQGIVREISTGCRDEDAARSVLGKLERLADECGFARLADCTAEALTRWLNRQEANGMSPGNRNEYRQELVGFGNWCVETHRLSVNPSCKVPTADAKLDCRRQRRAMTEAELGQLLEVARWRPLAEYGRETAAADKQSDGAGQRRKRSNWS